VIEFEFATLTRVSVMVWCISLSIIHSVNSQELILSLCICTCLQLVITILNSSYRKLRLGMMPIS
jgi:hypothetical protein